MAIADFSGTLRIASNDPASPRDIALSARASSFAAPVSFISYEGEATIYGITEFADLSDPPRKYRNSYPGFNGWLREAPGDNLTCFRLRPSRRVNYNDAGALTQQINIGYWRGNTNGAWTQTFQGPGTGPAVGTPWRISNSGSSGTGGGDELSLEDFDESASGDLITDWSPYWIHWVRSKRRKLFAIDDVTRTPSEPAFSSGLFWISPVDFAYVPSPSRFADPLRICAEWDAVDGVWNIFGSWAMSSPPVGSSPLANLYMVAAAGDVNIDDATVDADGVLVHSFPAFFSAPSYRATYFAFQMLPGYSMRFRMLFDGANEQYFPRLYGTLEELNDAGLNLSLYLPDGPPDSGSLEEPYQERLSIEDSPATVLEATGVETEDDEWAETVSVTGGITAESHSPIVFTGKTINANFTLPNLTPGRAYTVRLTYEQQPLPSGTSAFVSEDIVVQPGLATFKEVDVKVIAPEGFRRRLSGTRIVSSVPVIDVPVTPLNTRAILWYASALSDGGNPTPQMLQQASDLADAIDAWSGAADLRYFLPLIGDDIATALTPLYDRGLRGRPTNNNFVDADVSNSGGLVGDGSTKAITLPFKPSELGSSNSGGIGCWPLTTATTAFGVVMGMGTNPGSGVQEYLIVVNGTTQSFKWGTSANQASRSDSNRIADFYGQRSSATSRELFENGVSVATDTTSDSASAASTDDIRGMGSNNSVFASPTFWDGACGLFYATNGTLTPTEISELHDILTAFMTATGRI